MKYKNERNIKSLKFKQIKMKSENIKIKANKYYKSIEMSLERNIEMTIAYCY